jgi:hypothetical protein
VAVQFLSFDKFCNITVKSTIPVISWGIISQVLTRGKSVDPGVKTPLCVHVPDPVVFINRLEIWTLRCLDWMEILFWNLKSTLKKQFIRELICQFVWFFYPPRNCSTVERENNSNLHTHMQSCTHIKLMHFKHNTLYVRTKMLQQNQKKFLCIVHMFIFLKRPASSFQFLPTVIHTPEVIHTP